MDPLFEPQEIAPADPIPRPSFYTNAGSKNPFHRQRSFGKHWTNPHIGLIGEARRNTARVIRGSMKGII